MQVLQRRSYAEDKANDLEADVAKAEARANRFDVAETLL